LKWNKIYLSHGHIINVVVAITYLLLSPIGREGILSYKWNSSNHSGIR